MTEKSFEVDAMVCREKHAGRTGSKIGILRFDEWAATFQLVISRFSTEVLACAAAIVYTEPRRTRRRPKAHIQQLSLIA